MESLGQYTLFTRNGKPLACEASWLSSEADWDFVAGWEIASGADAPSSIRDSLEYTDRKKALALAFHPGRDRGVFGRRQTEGESEFRERVRVRHIVLYREHDWKRDGILLRPAVVDGNHLPGIPRRVNRTRNRGWWLAPDVPSLQSSGRIRLPRDLGRMYEGVPRVLPQTRGTPARATPQQRRRPVLLRKR